ncbi:MAG TPA: PH domain-containing protein [Candidatus Limnocylindrales bacterium]
MGYAQSLLAKDEHIVYECRQHWLAPFADSLRPIVLVLVGLLILGVAINTSWTGPLLVVPGLLLLVAIVWIAIILMTWRAEEYVITTRRVLKVEGLLDKKSGDSSLDKINDAVLIQGIWARIFKYGDLEILTANEQGVDRYTMLSRVVEFKKAMLNAKNSLDDGFRGIPGAATAQVPGKSSSSAEVTATLAQLADLRDKGAITPAEYERKKAELLGRI